MRIEWSPNPLAQIVELDEADRLHLRKAIEGDPLFRDLLEGSNPEEALSFWTAAYEEALLGPHVGDCTCCPSSCSKCEAEYLMGISTIKGLPKSARYNIDEAFRRYPVAEDALAYLEAGIPTPTRDASEELRRKWSSEMRKAASLLREHLKKETQ